MGKALAICIWTLCVGVVLLFLAHSFIGSAVDWWMPPLISKHGRLYDAQFNRTLIIVGIVFILAQAGLGYVVFRYSPGKNSPARYSLGNTRLEVFWTVGTLIVFVMLGIMSEHDWSRRNSAEAQTGALTVEVYGQQFAWNFRYAGPDGQFGRTDPKQIDDAAGNPVGIDDKDPAGKDDVVVSTLVIPVDRPVHLVLRSRDVIHSFFVPGLRVKQDLVPGMAIDTYFTPTVTGKYEIACAELCGLGHYKMKSYMQVLSEGDFTNWLKTKSLPASSAASSGAGKQ